MKVAIYARVSTDKQDLENQLLALRQYIENTHDSLVNIYLEKETGKYGKFAEKNRAEFKLIRDDAFKHKFDAILVWAMDRYTREGIEATLNYMRELESWNIKFISYSEPFFNFVDPMIRELLFAIMGWAAKMERLKISERTKAGLQRARKQGKHLGKKLSFDIKLFGDIERLRNEGLSYGKIAKILGIKNPGTVAYALKKLIPIMNAQNDMANGDAQKANEGNEVPTVPSLVGDGSKEQSQTEGATPSVSTNE